MSVYGGLVGAIAVAAKLSGRSLPERISPWDAAVTTLATHKLSRLLAKDPVTSPLRAPFTRFEGTTGPAELAEDVRVSGSKKTIGELVTCPFCLGMWVSTGFTAGYVFAPGPPAWPPPPWLCWPARTFSSLATPTPNKRPADPIPSALRRLTRSKIHYRAALSSRYSLTTSPGNGSLGATPIDGAGPVSHDGG